ncbi:MAG TPA: hypothetical protein VGN80_18995 [Devosiaceae bacterium]|nr:hypothetical protein [Devosiaceae bacterium]
MSPAMAAGISDTLHDMEWIVGMIDAVAAKPNRPARYKQAKAIESAEYINNSVTVEMADRRKPRR